jgi:putative MATE family efflux protein
MDFTQGKIFKKILLFSIPLLLGNIFQQLYNITDSVIVGNLLGPAALAAVGATTPIIKLSISLGIGITMGVSVLVSQYFGSRSLEDLRLTIKTSYVFFALFSFAVTILGLVFTRPVLIAIHTPSEVFNDAEGYLRVTLLGTFMMIEYNVVNAIFRGIGNSHIPLYVLIASGILNILLDLLFLIVLKFDVRGTALGTIISQGAAFVCSCVLFNYYYKDFRIRWDRISLDRRILKKCLKIGLPAGLKGSLYWGGYVYITSIINTFGTAAVAAFAGASRIDALVQTPLQSLGSGLASFVGQNLGAKQPQRIKSGIRISVGFGIITALVITFFVFTFANTIMRFFTSDDEVIRIGVEYLRIVSFFYIIYALQEVIQGLAVGCGNTIILMVSTITAMWIVRIPLAYLFSLKFGFRGIWFSIPTGWFIAMIFTNSYYLSGKWKQKLQRFAAVPEEPGNRKCPHAKPGQTFRTPGG